MSHKYLDDTGLQTFTEYVKGALNGKQDVISGKGLSSNDFTNEYMIKLRDLPANAQANVLEGVNVNNVDQVITNKKVNLTVPTKTSDLTNDSGYLVAADIANKVDKVEGKSLTTVDFTGYVTTGKANDTVMGLNATAEGTNNTVTGGNAHGEGNAVTASGSYAHAEGYQTTASQDGSHAEGSGTSASGSYAHSEGYMTTASGTGSHAEGSTAQATAASAHAEGTSTVASGTNSHAQNIGTIAQSSAQTAIGKYNVADTSDVYGLIVGNGSSADSRSNAMTVKWNSTLGVEKIATLDGSTVIEVADLATTSDIENVNAAIDDIVENQLDLHTQIVRDYGLKKTGKIYRTKLWHYDVNPTSAGEKLLDNAGLVCEPSTDTTVGQDDYADIPLFQWMNCNYVREDNGFAKVTALEGQSGYATTGSVDVGVLVMTPYYRFDDCGDYDLVSISDTPHLGFKALDASKMPDGSVCPYTIFSKYVSGVASDGLLRSQPGLHPEDSMSFNQIQVDYPKKGTGYHGAGMSKHVYAWLMMIIKYATKNSQTVFKGCTNYNCEYTPAVKLEEENNFFVVTNSQAANLLVGSSVRIGHYKNATEHDRGAAQNYDICKHALITGKEAYDENNTKIIVDCDPFATTDRTYNGVECPAIISSFHWISGSTDAVAGHHDGSLGSNTDSKHPYRIQGMEYNVGGYIVLSDAVVATHTDGTRDTLYKPYDMPYTIAPATIRNTFELIGTMPASTTTNVYDDVWIGDVTIKDGAWAPVTIGSSDATGVGDRFYKSANNIEDLREYLTCGNLWDGSDAGLGFLVSGHALSSRYWGFLAAD